MPNSASTPQLRHARPAGRLPRQAGRIVTTTLAAGLVTLSFFLSHSLSALAFEPTSENNERLAKALRRYPEADVNKDGVLTAAEAKDYMAKVGKAAGTTARTT